MGRTGHMAAGNLAMAIPSTPAGAVWNKAASTLRTEIGDAAFGSWLAPAALRSNHDGALCLVTSTGLAKNWIRRYAWRRIEELWAAHDSEGRQLFLKSRDEFEADGQPATVASQSDHAFAPTAPATAN